mmetsp:Transcript_26855/g.48411  ORF Transcript_26855/g.48411 Transcript_26855/m.48411 type:complete len:154 (-) Transcript_26855:1084-1545(-)
MSKYIGFGYNYLTTKPMQIFRHNFSKPSADLVEAQDKLHRFYREACRRIPYLLQCTQRIYDVHPVQAKINLGDYMRRNSHVRNLEVIDQTVSEGYEWLYESVWYYNHAHNWFGYLLPQKINDNSGFSYLEDKKLGDKSAFLKGFLTGKERPNS